MSGARALARCRALERGWALSGVLAMCALGPVAAQAASLDLCDRPARISAAQQDQVFRFAAVVKDELQRAGRPLALIARSGLNLSWFGLRYSHAGISLQGSESTPWAVRQLYYACDEGQPRVFDQGITGFLLGTDEPGQGYVSLVFLPEAASTPLARAALDKAQALRVLASQYSANAYPFSPRYQNCNQWVMELLASAWARPEELAQATDAPMAPRAQAQAWLQAQGYQPTVIDVGWRLLMWATALVPHLHRDDHPDADLGQQHFKVSMPDAIHAFVRRRVPEATRVELCHNAQHIVIHRGWDQMADGCTPGEGDTVIPLQAPTPGG